MCSCPKTGDGLGGSQGPIPESIKSSGAKDVEETADAASCLLKDLISVTQSFTAAEGLVVTATSHEA